MVSNGQIYSLDIDAVTAVEAFKFKKANRCIHFFRSGYCTSGTVREIIRIEYFSLFLSIQLTGHDHSRTFQRFILPQNTDDETHWLFELFLHIKFRGSLAFAK